MWDNDLFKCTSGVCWHALSTLGMVHLTELCPLSSCQNKLGEEIVIVDGQNYKNVPRVLVMKNVPVKFWMDSYLLDPDAFTVCPLVSMSVVLFGSTTLYINTINGLNIIYTSGQNNALYKGYGTWLLSSPSLKSSSASLFFLFCRHIYTNNRHCLRLHTFKHVLLHKQET